MVGPNGPRLLERRRATELEEAQLTAAAEALRRQARGRRPRHRRSSTTASTGARSTSSPSGQDPPKARIVELQERVDARLARAGLDGVGEVVELARALAREAGLAHPGVTSDVKHVEIGLTDKSDSMRYVLKALIDDRGRRPQDMIVLGDEFGPIGSSEGSDYLTLIPELRRSTFVSVGVEPNGVPPRVLHVGGGPDEFLRILHDQLTYREEVAHKSFPGPGPRPGLALRGQRLRPVPRARGRDLADGGQRRERHARGARGGLCRVDAGHLRGRRLRRRHRRAALSAAGPGAGLDRACA